MLVGTDMTPAFDAIPGLKDLVPREIGGDNKLSYDEICGNATSKLMQTCTYQPNSPAQINQHGSLILQAFCNPIFSFIHPRLPPPPLLKPTLIDLLASPLLWQCCQFFIYYLLEQGANILKSFPDIGSTFEIAVDESKRPKECKSTFRVYKDLPNDLMGTTGTFIKLNQDEIWSLLQLQNLVQQEEYRAHWHNRSNFSSL